MAFRIVLTKSVVKELDALPPKVHDKIVEHLQHLTENPRSFGAEKLTAIDAYKLRVGNHRIVLRSTTKSERSELLWSMIGSRFTKGCGERNKTLCYLSIRRSAWPYVRVVRFLVS
jgi:mRNA-degrading endonuclease RelE of RelBE toxin-antitoxin system